MTHVKTGNEFESKSYFPQWFPLFKGVFDVDKTPLNVGKVFKAEVEFLGSELRD